MNDLTDSQLLRAYAEHRSEAAFAEIVRRHVDLVYSAALRMVCDSHLAQDVTQGAFVALAKDAHRLAGHPVLSGWLHRTACNLAAQIVRTDVRRRVREQEAAAMNEMLADQPEAVWKQVAPLLDDALGELSEPDRDALLLRYFEHKSAREMAQTLGVSEEAAQKRVTRAVDRLREFFSRHGVTVGTSGLIVSLSANAVQAAPAGLAVTISTASALAGTSLAATATKAIVMTTLQKSVIAAALAVAIGIGLYEAQEAARLREQLAAAPQPPLRAAKSTNDGVLQARVNQLVAENAALGNALARAKADTVRLETERQQAVRSTGVFQDLAKLAGSRDPSSTNAYPTSRHVMAGMGRLGRLAVQLKKDEASLSPEEKAENKAGKLKAMAEFGTLLQAMKQLNEDKPSGTDSPPDDPTDNMACVLYGLLDLNERQFGEVYNLVQLYSQRAKESAPAGDNPTPEASAAFTQIKEQGEAALKAVLTPEQAKIFEAASPMFQVGPNSFNFNFKFEDN